MEPAWAATVATGPGCETADGLLVEPVSAVSSLAFVVAGAVVLARGRRPAALPQGRPAGPQPGRRPAAPGTGSGAGRRTTARYAGLVAAIGVGSVVQHGPDPVWSDAAHDLPLVATLAFLAADALAVLVRRDRQWWWWAAPTLVLLVVVVAAPRPGDLAQAAVAAVAVALTIARALAVPGHRRAVGWSLALLAAGAVIGTLSRTGGPLCVPGSLWQGHAVWHVLAAAALVVLAPVVGDRGPTLGRTPPATVRAGRPGAS